MGTIGNIFKVRELRNRLFFTFVVLAVFRLGCVLTVPGIDAAALLEYFDNAARQNNNAFANYMDFFVGGAFSRFSVFMLGVMPYISTQIILQLVLIIFPSLKKIAMEDGGHQKMQMWSRVGTVFVSLIQSFAITIYARNIGVVSINNPWAFNALAMLTVTTGTMITIWLGDQITARGVGNGISILIFAGIVARMPTAIARLVESMRNGDLNPVFVVIALFVFLGLVVLVVYEESGERKIPVHYAKRVVGRKMYGGQNTYIPFKVNPSNVIPLIFASSVLQLPLQLVSSVASNSSAARWIQRLSIVLNPNGWVYNVVLAFLIIFFAYFYTQVTLNPTEIAKQIRENGGSIPGVRTDKTEEYLQKILNRLVLPGALFLVFVAILPTIIQGVFKFPQEVAALMGGTSLIIMVGVDLDTMSQIEGLLRMHHQDGFMKKGRLRSRNRSL